MEFLQLSEARYSLRKFSDRPVEAEKLAGIIGKYLTVVVELSDDRMYQVTGKKV